MENHQVLPDDVFAHIASHLPFRENVALMSSNSHLRAAIAFGIKHADFDTCPYDASTVMSMVQQYPILESLELAQGIYRQCLNDEQLLQLTLSCPHLVKLDIGGSHLLTSASFDAFAQLPNLTYLNLSRTVELDPEAISKLGIHCSKLTYLDLSGANSPIDCTDAMSAALCNWPSLTYLDLLMAFVTTSEILTVLAGCPAGPFLQHLGIGPIGNIRWSQQQMDLHLPSLRSIHAAGSGVTMDMVRKATSLQSVIFEASGIPDLSNHTNLTHIECSGVGLSHYLPPSLLYFKSTLASSIRVARSLNIPHLRVLWLVCHRIAHRSELELFTAALSHMRNLEELRLDEFCLGKSAQIEGSSPFQFLEAVPLQLRTLSLSLCNVRFDSSLTTIIARMKRLVYLDISTGDGSDLNDYDLKCLLPHLRNLELLNISGQWLLTNAVVGFMLSFNPALTMLMARNCPAMKHTPMMQRLVACGCTVDWDDINAPIIDRSTSDDDDDSNRGESDDGDDGGGEAGPGDRSHSEDLSYCSDTDGLSIGAGSVTEDEMEFEGYSRGETIACCTDGLICPTLSTHYSEIPHICNQGTQCVFYLAKDPAHCTMLAHPLVPFFLPPPHPEGLSGPCPYGLMCPLHRNDVHMKLCEHYCPWPEETCLFRSDPLHQKIMKHFDPSLHAGAQHTSVSDEPSTSDMAM